ncbi:MAG: enoyl-CoA hydratase [Bryobacterales bacterium]|nr:enoyl-CoA hydratase [Bryobacterales bacterium]MDE0294020.1 enoyl-CoA hydratase [Bryobacterales bacterium]MDE0432692.1 enoyl-CoA hydratase [Bryobacterales bacterium]
MSEPLLRVGTVGPVATIRLNRPRQRNALSLDLIRDLIAVLEGIGTNREVAAVILAAEGSAFCAGHDLNEMVDRNVNEYRQIFDLCTDLMTAIQRIPQPVIAQVHGMATAAGCQLVAACDLVVASENARFATPGVRIGLFCSTPMVALTRAIGRKRALEMLLTGKSIDASTACEWGLVNRVVPRDMLAKTTRDLANEIAQASEMVVGIGKTAFYAQIDLDQSKAYTYAKEVMSMNALASDAQEGMSAFLEKRPPSWTGR